MSHVLSLFFFFHCRHFHLSLVAASISHFLTTATKFSWCSPKKIMSTWFFTLALDRCHPFFSMSFAGLPPTFSFSSSFSFSIFQICGHDNLSKVNTLDNTDTETISAFRFRLYWLFNCLCFARSGWLRLMAMRFPVKITSSCLWVAIPVEWVTLHWYACGADGRTFLWFCFP